MLKRKLIQILTLLVMYAGAIHAVAPIEEGGLGRWFRDRARDAIARADRQAGDDYRERIRLEVEAADLAVRANNGDARAQERHAQVNRQLEDHREAERERRRLGVRMADAAIDLGQGAANFAENRLKAEDERKKVIGTAAVVAKMEGKSALERLKYFTSAENLTRVGLAAAGIGGALIVTYFAAKFGLYYAQKFVGMPKLVRESSDKNLWESIVSLFQSEGEMADFMSNVILNPELDAIVRDLAKAAQETKNDGIPFRNLLLYGEPGTGKTMIAKLIARHCGMNYVIISGADFIQFEEGKDVEQVHLLFDRIEKSDVPYIVFIDEAKSAFAPREGSSPRQAAVVDAFLSRTGTKSDKFMLIFAANDVNLDWAILSRISKKVHIPLPAIDERVKILQLYLTKYFIDRATVLDGEQVMLGSEISEHSLRQIAQELTGWSGRDLEDLVGEIRYVLSGQHTRTVTPSILKIAADEKLKQRQELEKYAGEVAVKSITAKL